MVCAHTQIRVHADRELLCATQTERQFRVQNNLVIGKEFVAKNINFIIEDPVDLRVPLSECYIMIVANTGDASSATGYVYGQSAPGLFK